MSPIRLTPDAWQRHITSWQQSGLSQKSCKPASNDVSNKLLLAGLAVMMKL